jgi:hypothetical protein
MERNHSMSRSLVYNYADGDNYKQEGMIVLTAPLSREQASIIRDSMDVYTYFIPEKVGLQPLPWSMAGGEADHPWHTIDGLEACDFNDPSDDWDRDLYDTIPVGCEAVNGPIGPDELTARFVAAKGRWEDEEPEDDGVKVEQGDTAEGDVWITVYGVTIHVLRGGGVGSGIVIDVWPEGPSKTDEGPLGSLEL